MMPSEDGDVSLYAVLSSNSSEFVIKGFNLKWWVKLVKHGFTMFSPSGRFLPFLLHEIRPTDLSQMMWHLSLLISVITTIGGCFTMLDQLTCFNSRLRKQTLGPTSRQINSMWLEFEWHIQYQGTCCTDWWLYIHNNFANTIIL